MTICDKEFMGVQGRCTACGGEVHGFTSNDALIAVRPEAEGTDWWYACANPACAHHYGQEYDQGGVSWCQRLPGDDRV